jgi:disulfide oxidoreductase YuzD
MKMAKKDKLEIHWLTKPQEHDYPSACSYLSLIYDEKTSAGFIAELKKSAIVEFKAKDIFRASNLSQLGVSNLHVRRDIKKIKCSEMLSPLLLVRDQANGKLIIADGYQRLCAVYVFDEDALIPCKIV